MSLSHGPGPTGPVCGLVGYLHGPLGPGIAIGAAAALKRPAGTVALAVVKVPVQAPHEIGVGAPGVNQPPAAGDQAAKPVHGEIAVPVGHFHRIVP